MSSTKNLKPKVIVVAGGFATRMKKISKKLPKCLVKLDGKPLIQYQIEFFKRKGYNNFIFCIAYLGYKIKRYFKNGSSCSVEIQYSEEPKGSLLGTAGAVKLTRSMVNDTFIVYYGDNLTTEDFDKVLKFHKQKKSDFTIVLRQLPKDYVSSSIITMDNNNRIKTFLENPSKDEFKKFKDKKIYINNGIYFVEPKILQEIPRNTKYDFAKQLIPKLIKKNINIYGYVSGNFFREIGTLEKYKKFKREFKNVKALLNNG